MSLIRKILGMKDLSAEFDIPEVKLNKKSIPKEKKSEERKTEKAVPLPPRQQPKYDAFGPVSNPMPSFNYLNKTELSLSYRRGD